MVEKFEKKFLGTWWVKQNIDETDSKHSKQPEIHIKIKIHTSLWIFKISRKKSVEPIVLILLPSLCDFRSKIHGIGYGFKNL
jgi:hypothetical protein